MTEKKYTDAYFLDRVDEATDIFRHCYSSIKKLLDEADEHNPEVKEVILSEIAFYLANYLYLYHRDALSARE